MMNLTCTLLLTLSILAILTTSTNNYTQYKLISNPNHYDKAVFLDQLNLVFLYTQNKRTAVYNIYTWQQNTNINYTDFYIPPNYIEPYVDHVNQANLIFSNTNGRIRQKSFNNGTSSQTSLWNITEENKYIRRVTASKDGTMYAAFCQNGSFVYIGNFSTNVRLIKLLNYTEFGQVLAIRWKADTHSLYISGANQPSANVSSTFFKIYNVLEDSEEDISSFFSHKVIDFDFSPDGVYLYYLQEMNDQNQQKIYILDILKNTTTQFGSAQITNYFILLRVKGNYLSAVSKTFEYIWNIKQRKLVGSFVNPMTFSGLSSDGSILLSLYQTPGNITLLQLCRDKYYYDGHLDICMSCKSPCQNCFNSASKCSSCTPRNFLQQNFTCAPCEPGCLTCNDSVTCENCDYDNHWILFFDHCVCDQAYLLINNTICMSCNQLIDGCAFCIKKDRCKECRDGYELTDGKKCVLVQGASNTLLIVIICVAGVVMIVVGVVIFKIVQRRKRNNVKKQEEGDLPRAISASLLASDEQRAKRVQIKQK